MQREVVRHYHLEWVIWVPRDAGHAAISRLNDVRVDPRPEDCLVNPPSHTGDPSMSGVDSYQDLVSQGLPDYDAISVAQDSINFVEVMPESVVFPQ